MKALGQQTFIIRMDSKVIQEHIEKESEARNPVLMKYLEKSEKWKDASKDIQCNIFQEMTTTKQTNWRKQQPEIKKCLPMFLRDHQRTIYQGIKVDNRECCGNSRLESRNHGLSERPL
jgi:hypothetical protein